jgi:hypothetical protein
MPDAAQNFTSGKEAGRRLILSAFGLGLSAKIPVWLFVLGLAAAMGLTLVRWPLLLIVAGSFIVMAAILATVNASDNQLENAVKSLRYCMALALIIGAGIFLQVVPLKFVSLDQPIWVAMGNAIGQPTPGYATVDTTVTIITLAKYLVILSAALATTLLCANRYNAEKTLSAITWLLTMVYFAFFLKTMVDGFQASVKSEQFWAEWIGLATLGLLAHGAALVRSRLRHVGRGMSKNSSQPVRTGIWLAAKGGIIGLLMVPLIARGWQVAIIPSISAISIFLSIFVIKRMGLGIAGALFVVTLVISGLWFAGLSSGFIGPHSVEMLGRPPEIVITTSVRIFQDFKWSGSGAGTYSELLPMYETIGDADMGFLNSVPAAFSFLIELGIPITLLSALFVICLAHAVLREVVHRAYPQNVLACSTVIYVVGAAFTPGAALSFPVAVVAATFIALGLTPSQFDPPPRSDLAIVGAS